MADDSGSCKDDLSRTPESTNESDKHGLSRTDHYYGAENEESTSDVARATEDRNNGQSSPQFDQTLSLLREALLNRSQATKSGKEYTALYHYEAKQQDEISFRKGESLFVLGPVKGDDYVPAYNSKGEMGLVPENYIQQEKATQIVPPLNHEDDSFTSDSDTEENVSESYLEYNGKEAMQVSQNEIEEAGRVIQLILASEQTKGLVKSVGDHDCISGQDFIDWMMENSSLDTELTREQAKGNGQVLLEEGIIVHVKGRVVFEDKETYYYFKEVKETVTKKESRKALGKLEEMLKTLTKVGPDSLKRVSLRKKKKDRSSEDVRTIYEIIRKLKALKDVPEEKRKELASFVGFEVYNEKREVVYKKEDKATCWYIILRGSVKCIKDRRIILKRGEAFGELELGDLRDAKIVTNEDRCEFITVEKDQYFKFIKKKMEKASSRAAHEDNEVTLDKICERGRLSPETKEILSRNGFETLDDFQGLKVVDFGNIGIVLGQASRLIKAVDSLAVEKEERKKEEELKKSTDSARKSKKTKARVSSSSSEKDQSSSDESENSNDEAKSPKQSETRKKENETSSSDEDRDGSNQMNQATGKMTETIKKRSVLSKDKFLNDEDSGSNTDENDVKEEKKTVNRPNRSSDFSEGLQSGTRKSIKSTEKIEESRKNSKERESKKLGKVTGGRKGNNVQQDPRSLLAQERNDEQSSRQTRSTSRSKSSTNTAKKFEGCGRDGDNGPAKTSTKRKTGHSNSEIRKGARTNSSDYVQENKDRGQEEKRLPPSKGKGHFQSLIKETGFNSENQTSKKKGRLKRFKDYMVRLVGGGDGEYAETDNQGNTTTVNGIPVYKFPLRETYRNPNSRIRKVTIGNTLNVSAEKTILLVGSTGSGKSTMSDGMINHIYGMTWEDNYRLTLVDLMEDEKKKVNKITESQTEWITAYTVPTSQFSCLPYALTIVDMPGFGDTRGVQRDKELVKQLKELFSSGGESGIDAVNAVCFIARAGDARLTATQRYIFNQILLLFGKNIAQNIQILISFADGKPPVVMEALKEAGVPFNKSFKFNNSALYSSVGSDDQKAGEDPFTKIFWEMGMRSYTDFFDYLGTVSEQSLTLTAEVLKEREQLNTIISNLRENIKRAMVKIVDHNKLEEDLQKNKHLMETHSEYEIVRTKNKFERVKMKDGKYVTYCEHCDYTCHEPCNDESVEECAAMEDGKCEVCPGECLATDHISRDFYYEATVIKIKTTLDDVKEKFLKAKKGTADLEVLLDPIRKDRETLEGEVKDMVSQVTKCIKRLDEIALKRGQPSSIDYYRLLIEDEKQNGQPGFEGRVAKLEQLIEEDELSMQIENEDELLPGSQQTAV